MNEVCGKLIEPHMSHFICKPLPCPYHFVGISQKLKMNKAMSVEIFGL